MGATQMGAQEPRSDRIQSGKPGHGSPHGQRPVEESHSKKIQDGKPAGEQSE